jgi:protein gp37
MDGRPWISSEIKKIFNCFMLNEKMTENPSQIVIGVINSRCKCYAGHLHSRYSSSKGYADNFDRLERFPGRMKTAAGWNDLSGKPRPGKSWLDGLPRTIFVSDMGDSFAGDVDYQYLKTEVVDNALSEKGSRHIWLWLTKRPTRMAAFSDWIQEVGLNWPDNLVAMTTVTSSLTINRVQQLQRVRCRHRGLSVEPLWGQVELPLEGIDWVIVGGESGTEARAFDLEWARSLRVQCERVETAFFVKQLGANPIDGGTVVNLSDRHGGNWDEWPEDLRIRQMPNSFSLIGGAG